MEPSEVWTIGRLLQWTTDYLKRHGAETPRLDAEVLLAHARCCERIDLYTAFNEPADETLRETFRELVRQRAEGTPVAYLVGYREFFSLIFRVSPDVLIPRPETELLVVEALEAMKRDFAALKHVRLADVGTGSGAIAVTVAHHESRAELTAVDICPRALEAARSNAADHDVTRRIDFVQGDLLEGLPPGRRFELILSNPPYVGTAEREALSRDVRQFEPAVALFAGPDGTEIIRRLIPQSAERLVAGGWLMMEVSPMIAVAVGGLIERDGRFSPPETVRDLAGRPRVIKARRKLDAA